MSVNLNDKITRHQIEFRKALTAKKGINRSQATQLFFNRVEELQLKGLDCDPIQVLMEIASGRKLNEDGTTIVLQPQPEACDRVKAAAELLSYMYPKRKAIELSGTDGAPILFGVAQDSEPLPGAEEECLVPLPPGPVLDVLNETIEAEGKSEDSSAELPSD
jgi:hypothetical protein